MIGSHIDAVAALLQAATAAQSHAPTDSVVVESPLPGGVAAVVRFLLNTVPPWIQIGGVIVGALVGAWVLFLLVKHRRALTGWVVSRPRGMQAAIAVVAVVALAGVAGAGTVTWKYTQHSNDFCSGCHVMKTPFQKFGNSENKHAELSCHDCHQQSLVASARQLYLWVAERPAEIGKHAKVANGVCETCHVTPDTAKWQRVAATAGHRVHLESDSTVLKDMQCVSCHGVEVHGFSPVNKTCGQSGCHAPDESDIALGKMTGQTVRHCTTCHVFTADVPLLATTDSARGTLVPGKGECLGCHEMRKVLPDFDQGKDPHGGKCGTCHNPHTQKKPSEALSCATAGCHANWRDTPFHVGASHERVGQQCLTCHMPHSSRLDASTCEGCHVAVRSRGRLRPPLPFDTSKALRRAAAPSTPRLHAMPYTESRHAVTSGPSQDDAPAPESFDDAPPFERDEGISQGDDGGIASSRPPPAAADTFPHARHAKLACLECHETGDGHGRLTFQPPRGCAICHHQAPSQSRCSSCHQPSETAAPRPATMTVTVPGHQPAPRTVQFLHSRHSDRTCVECHTTPVTLAVPESKAQCSECHRKHDAPAANCTTCHVVTQPKAAHKTLETAHQRCDACHTAATVAQLTPTRNFCSTCHTAQAKNHYDARQCSTCHFLAEPSVYRAKLVTAAR